MGENTNLTYYQKKAETLCEIELKIIMKIIMKN